MRRTRDARRELLCVAILAIGGVVAAHPAGASEGADDLVARASEAQGGQTSWDAVDRLVLRGSYSIFSTPQPFVIYRQRPDLYRFEHRLLDDSITHGYDGEQAWWINTSLLSPVPWAIEPPAPAARAIAAEAELGGPLLDHRKRGHIVESSGRVDLEGRDLLELVVTLASGGVERWYLDPETYLPATRLSKGGDGLQEKDQRVDFYDYRATAGGLVLPHRLEIELGYNFVVLEVERVEVNPTLDAALFAMPVAGMDALASLAGRFRVSWDSRPNPGMPWSESGEQEVEVRALHRGALLEEALVYRHFATPRRIQRWRSYDRFRQVYRTSLFDSMTGHVDTLEGQLQDGRLTLSDVATGTPWESKGVTFHTREITYDLGPEGYKVDLESSVDGGKSWLTVIRFTYTRLPEPDS